MTKTFSEALHSTIHNALIDGPRLESDQQSELNRLIDLLHDRITATIAQYSGMPVGYTSRKQLEAVKAAPSSNHHIMWGEPLPYHEDIALYELLDLGVGWRDMSTAPTNGKHCILCIKSSSFYYAVQGCYHEGQWDCFERSDVKPLCWMPTTRIPTRFLQPEG